MSADRLRYETPARHVVEGEAATCRAGSTGDTVLDALLHRRCWDSGDGHAARYEHPASELAERFGVTRRAIERWRAGVHLPRFAVDWAAVSVKAQATRQAR